MDKGFQIFGDIKNPFHLSVGAVILDNLNVILLMKKDGIYTLPRETVYLRESLEDSLVRGVEEEVGIIVKPKRFLGSQISFFKRSDGSNIEKTTLYFLVEKVGKGFKKQEFDEKQDKEVVMNIEEATEVLKSQHNDEYRILQKIFGLK